MFQQRLSDFNWKIEIFLRDLKKFQQEVITSDPAKYDSLSDAIANVRTLLQKSNCISNPNNGNDARSAAFAFDEETFVLNQFITCRVCCVSVKITMQYKQRYKWRLYIFLNTMFQIQIPLTKGDYLSHVTSDYHKAAIVRVKGSSAAQLDANQAIGHLDINSNGHHAPQSSAAPAPNSNTTDNAATNGSHSKVAVQKEPPGLKKPIPNVFDDDIFTFIDPAKKDDKAVGSEKQETQGNWRVPGGAAAANRMPRVEEKRPAHIISCETINKGIKGESALFKPMAAFAFDSLFEDYPHLKRCNLDDLLGPLKDKEAGEAAMRQVRTSNLNAFQQNPSQKGPPGRSTSVEGRQHHPHGSRQFVPSKNPNAGRSMSREGRPNQPNTPKPHAQPTQAAPPKKVEPKPQEKPTPVVRAPSVPNVSQTKPNTPKPIPSEPNPGPSVSSAAREQGNGNAATSGTSTSDLQAMIMSLVNQFTKLKPKEEINNVPSASGNSSGPSNFERGNN